MHYNALFALDIKAAKLKSDCDIAQFRISLLPHESVAFKSNIKTIGVDVPQVLLEANYQLMHPDVAVCLEVQLLEYYELDQQRVSETRYYYPQQQFLQISSAQTLCFRCGKHEIFAEAQVQQLQFSNVARFPIVELALRPIVLPLSKADFKSLFVVGIQSPTHDCFFSMRSSVLDTFGVCFPLSKEFLVRIMLQITVAGSQHYLTLFTMRVTPKPEMKKGIFFAVNDIELKLKAPLFRVVDCILHATLQKQDFFSSQETGKVQIKDFASPGFLYQLADEYEMRLADFNYPAFQPAKLISKNANKKLQKVLDAQFAAMRRLSDDIQGYDAFQVKGTAMVYIETSNYITERSPALAFHDVCQRAQGAAFVSLIQDSDEFGYVVLGTKDFQNLDIMQESELGSGNLAVVNTNDCKKYQLAINRHNTSQALKLFESAQKSLVASLKDSITLHALVYQRGRELVKHKFVIQKQQIIDALQTNGHVALDLTPHAQLIILLHDSQYTVANTQEFDAVLKCMEDNFLANRQLLPAAEFSQEACFYQFCDAQGVLAAQNYDATVQTFLQIVEAERARKIEQERIRQEQELQRRIEQQKRQEEEERLELQRREQERLLAEQQQKEEDEKRELSRQRRREESLRLGVTETGGFDHRLFQLQKDDEERRRRQIEKQQEEERQREEERHKLELKKLRNLKFQLQRQQFVVNTRGDTQTFYYNMGEGEDNAGMGKKYDNLPKVTVQHQIVPPSPNQRVAKFVCSKSRHQRKAIAKPESAESVLQNEEPDPAQMLIQLPQKSQSQGDSCIRRLARSPLHYTH